MVEFTTSTIEDIKKDNQGQGTTFTSTPSAQTTTTKSSSSGMFTTSSPDDVGKGKLPYSQVKSKINQDRFDIPTDVLMDDTYGGGFNRDTALGTGTSSTEALKTFSENEDPTKIDDYRKERFKLFRESEEFNDIDDNAIYAYVDSEIDDIRNSDPKQFAKTSEGFLGATADVLVGGVTEGIEQGVRFIYDVDEALSDKLNIGKFVWEDNDFDGRADSWLPTWYSRDEVEKARKETVTVDGNVVPKLNPMDSVLEAVINTSDNIDAAIPDTQNTVGAMAKGLVQFGTGFILTRKMVGGKGLGATMGHGAIADAAYFDPFDANISAFLKQYPAMNNVFIDALATDEDANTFINRIKNSGEGAILGGIGEGIVRGFSKAKSGKQKKTLLNKQQKEYAANVAWYSNLSQKAKAELELNGKIPEHLAKSMDEAQARIAELSKNQDELLAKPDKEVVEENIKAYDEKYDINLALGATLERNNMRQAAASTKARQNQGIAEELIRAFEENLSINKTSTGRPLGRDDPNFVTISTREKGKLVIDTDAIRDVGRETLNNIDKQTRGAFSSVKEYELDTSSNLALGELDDFTQPMLRPEKFDAIVAVASELKKLNPEYFQYGKSAINRKKNESIIDVMSRLTIEGKLIEDAGIMDLLAKYDLSFEDYLVTVVGSASEAGRTLQKFSQLGRMRPKSEKEMIANQKTIEAQGRIKQTFLRIENIRRGLMVSKVATAMRNLTSLGIRQPLEALMNVPEHVLLNIGEGNYGRGLGIFGGQNSVWEGAFSGLKYTFRDPIVAKEFTDFILDRPEFAKQFSKMFNTVNEIQMRQRKGMENTYLDKYLTKGEDGVYLLNSVNRWQEFLGRRGAFIGELDRLIKKEWKVKDADGKALDVFDIIAKGGIKDLMGDATEFVDFKTGEKFNLKPEGAASFTELIERSTKQALDVTYAADPELAIFRAATRFITNNGLTVVVPFPRFMFKSMELMGEMGGGTFIPLTRKIAGFYQKKVKGAEEGYTLTARDRKMISRNMVGLMTVAAATMYRMRDGAESDYKKMNISEDQQIDTTPQFPLRQFLYLGEAVKQKLKGENAFEAFIGDGRELAETFMGTNIRLGVGGSILNDIRNLIGTDLTAGEQASRTAGRALGNYLNTFLIPLAQTAEFQRALSEQDVTMQDLRPEPTLDKSSTFFSNLITPAKRTVNPFVSPFRQNQAPASEYVGTRGDTRERQGLLSRVLLGINVEERESEAVEYLQKYGFKTYELGSRSRSPAVQRHETRVLRDQMPLIAEMARRRAEIAERNWEKSDSSITKAVHIKRIVKDFIKRKLNEIKSTASSKSFGASEDPAYTKYMLEVRRLSSSRRAAAMAKFEEMEGRSVNGTDPKDLARLVAIAKKMP